MRRIVIGAVAVGLLAAQITPALARPSRSTVIRTDCTRDRCVLRERSGVRVGTVEDSGDGRLRFEDRRGRLTGKGTYEDGTLRIQRPRR